jgi:hypothetical protein
MSLFFLHPLYLFGLAAASLPVLIHLLNRRRLKRVRFPAVRFILLSQKRISRSYRLRHWLLLALRTLAVVFLALLLANPIFQTGAGLFAGGGPVALVVLLDNSLSMKWSGDGDGFKQAKEAARLLISNLNAGDRAALITTDISGKEALRLKSEKAVLLRELEQTELADGSANFSAALTKAYELLNIPAGQKEIRLITDLGLTGWDQFSTSSLKQYDPSIPFKTIRIGNKQKPLNGTVKAVRLASQGVGVNLPIDLEATIANFGDREIKDLLVQLSIDGQNKEQKLATIPAKGETTVGFQTRLSGDGGHLDEDGYLFVMGRTDDVINVAGHRLSTGEMEEVLASHPAVAECAVIGVSDEVKGQIPRGFVVLKSGVNAEPRAVCAELVQLVRDEIGPVAALRQVDVVAALPKTRSGKILRKTMRGIADGRDEPVPSTIEDPAALDALRPLLRSG